MAFVPIHNHSDYSLLDGASQLPLMVERAKELGMPALALTDHGVMYGAIELLKLCKAVNIKPIIGNEMYVINGSIDDPQPKKERRYHLVVLAKNEFPFIYQYTFCQDLIFFLDQNFFLYFEKY